MVTATVFLTRSHIGPLLTAGAAVLAGAFVARRDMPAHDKRAAVLTAAVATTVFDYLAWRAHVINWDAAWLSVPLFLAELFAAIHIVGFHHTLWPREPVPLANDEDPTVRPVFILIPTVDEGPDVLGPTVRGALRARGRYLQQHPDASVEIVVCNDGGSAGAPCSRAVEQLCRDLRVQCVTRVTSGGAKAGNLEHARQFVGATGDALIVIFDADQVADSEFLIATVPNFRDSSVAWAQTGQYYRNAGSPISRWANDQQAIFYRVLCPGKAAGNSAFICGTNVVIRAEALDEIGGFPQTSVTEDFAASILLHQRWRSVFVPGVLARGLGPIELRSYLGQQRRWARGTTGVLRSHWRDILVPRRGRGLHPEQSAQYALASTHYLSGLRDFVYVLVPIVFLTTGVAAVRGANLNQFLLHFVPYWILTQFAFWHAVRGKASWRGIIIGFGSFPVLVLGALEGLLGSGGAFTVTAKRRTGAGTLRYVWFHILCFGACIGAIVAAAIRGGGGATLISACWAAYTGLLLAAFLGLGIADYLAAASLDGLRPPTVRARPMGLRLGVAALGVAVVVMATTIAVWGDGGQAVSAAVSGHGNPRAGLDFSTDLATNSRSVIETKIGYHAGLIGRTQEISDHFDRRWAQGVSERGGRPWVTLLFTAPGHAQFEASLLSIANGLHDAQLRRWAQEIAAWGRPVNLTILRQVDRNWVVTSAVTNGGIPQDSARAWMHVRNVFRTTGASNITWIWAPADPSADRAYAPPAGSYDGVLLSLIEYPGTARPDPATALASVHDEHPAKPLLVETSVAGPDQLRSDWLRSLGTAIGKRRDVAALIYHEGGPKPSANQAERASWSLGPSPRLTDDFAWAVSQIRSGIGALGGLR